MTEQSLESRIEAAFQQGTPPADAEALVLELRDALTAGTARAAEPDASHPLGWRVNAWVKRGLLLGFKIGRLVEYGNDLSFVDKHMFPARHLTVGEKIRVVPGGSSIRTGAYVAPGVVCMPPMYINVGAYVDEGSMIDSHALVGSCAQVGRNVHVSAGAQIGGVMEPVNASPVILEDDVLVGGNCGIYEGALVRKRAVIGAGVILTRATPVYDAVNGSILRAAGDVPLVIPEDAVVVAGARPMQRGKGAEWGLSLYTPVIVKYRDAKTDLSLELEELLR